MNTKWIKYHVLFFTITWLFNYVFNFYTSIPEDKLLSYSLFFVIDQAILVGYFYAVLFLSQRLLKNIIYFIPFQVLLMLVGCFLLSLGPYLFYTLQGTAPQFSNIYFIKMFAVAYISFSSFGFLFLQKWDESTHQKLQLIESLSEAELVFLRSQMSPHFLLNTLNTIYSLALNKSPEVYPAISELKNIYSYVQRSQGKVSLKDEIEYLENFINIQKRRFKDAVEMSVIFSIDRDYQIEPLLLSSFVENAFKHGVSMKEKSFIYIKLLAIDGELEYEVENSNHSLKHKDATSGIGLKNLSRRLELLYPGKFSLKIFQGGKSYTSILTIENI